MHRPKKHSSHRIWSAWGDWFWSRTHKRYYSQRQDTEGTPPDFVGSCDAKRHQVCWLTRDRPGEIETRWGPVQDRGTPRGGDGQEELVDALQGVQLGDGEDDEYQDNRPYSVSSPFYPPSTHRRVPRSVRTNSHTASYQLSQPTHGAHTAPYSQSTGSGDNRKKEDRKGKGRSYYDPEDEDYDAAYPSDPDDDPSRAGQGSAFIQIHYLS